MVVFLLTGIYLLAWCIPVSAAGLTLPEAYDLALKHNDKISSLRQEIRQSEENVSIATSGLLPRIELEATTVKRKDLPKTNEKNTIGQATLSQHIYQGGKVWYGRELALLYNRGQKLDYFRGVQNVLFSVANQFYQVKLNRKQIEILKNTRKRSQDQLKQARGRYEVDMTTRTPVLRAKVQLSRARQQLMEARNNYQVSLSELALELGTDTAPIPVQESLDSRLKLEKLGFYYSRAYTNRRDYLRAKNMLKQARKQVEIQMADRYPSLKVQATGSYYDEEVNTAEDNWEVMGLISYPLFSGGKEEAEINRAQAKYDQAKAQLERLQQQIKIQVKEAYSNFQTRQKVIKTLENQVSAAQKNYQEIDARSSEGLVNEVDVSDAITVLNEAQLRLATEKIRRRLTYLRLKLAVGKYQENLLSKRLAKNHLN